MEYKGNLYGKVGDIYFPLEMTADYVDRLEEYSQQFNLSKEQLIPPIIEGLIKAVKSGDIVTYVTLEPIANFIASELSPENDKPAKDETPSPAEITEEVPTAFEWHNYETGHAYVELQPLRGR